MEFKLGTSLFDITKSILVIVAIAFIFFNYNKLVNWINKPSEVIALTTKIEELEAGLIKYTAKPDDTYLKELVAALKEQNSIALKALEKDGKKIDQLTQVVTKLQSDFQLQQGSSYKDEDKPTEPSTRDFYDTVTYRPDSNGEQLPMARVFFHPELVDSEPWTVQNFPLNLYTNVIQTENKDGSYSNYVETYFTNDFVSTSKGKKYYFKSDVAWAKKEITEKKFRLNTRLGVSSNLSLDDVFPGIDVSFASYGKTERDIDWRFLTIGIGGSKDSIYGYFKPIEYNTGNFIPLIENLYIGPFINYGEKGTEFGGGISVLF